MSSPMESKSYSFLYMLLENILYTNIPTVLHNHELQFLQQPPKPELVQAKQAAELSRHL